MVNYTQCRKVNKTNNMITHDNQWNQQFQSKKPGDDLT